MSEWFETLGGLLEQGWTVLEQVTTDVKSDARFPTLASLGTDGAPEVRSVALRGTDRLAGAVCVHTDIASTKIDGIRRDHRVSLHLWQPSLDLQLRLRGVVTILAGNAVQEVWNRLPKATRGNYGVTPAPGTPIARSDSYCRVPDHDRFAVLDITLDQIDIVHLSADYHLRALFRRQDGWVGQWLAP